VAVGIRGGLIGVASLDFGLTVLWVLVVVDAVIAAAAAAACGILVHAGGGAVDRQVAAEVTRLDSPRALQNAGEWAEPLRERK
jgi:hypothetical protein